MFCDGIILVWIKEIHINKKWKNTLIANYILKHELTHYKFIKIMQKYYKMFKIEEKMTPKNWEKLIKLTLLINFWIISNNIWDFIDCLKLSLLKYLYLKKYLYLNKQKKINMKLHKNYEKFFEGFNY